MIHEINSSDWPLFCQRVTAQQAGATMKLEVIGADGGKGGQVSNATFQSLTFDQSDSCSDVITLRLKSDREIVHEIIEPIHIQLHSSGTSGDFETMQIGAESGVTILTLHPAIHTQMLEGLKTSLTLPVRR